ncbi:MAG: ribosome small subunit-dependent GTPase A, partial [Zoogloeaceae bacterium]|nr:ribosome small subunit-dependent GTPase A [Zoogloeaceae bacterium]
MKPVALVIAAHGRQYRVRLPDGEEWLCYPRGKKSEVVCGDRVQVKKTGDAQGVIEQIEPRQSLLYRSNALRQKLIAANVDQAVLVVATQPAFSERLLSRCLIAAQSQGIVPLIVLNKCDLTEKLPAARNRLACLIQQDYRVLELCAYHSVAPLLPELEGKTSVLVGQSGMGKSTLINALIPGTVAATREISAALDSGKHTTTHAQLYDLNPNSRLIDSPGLQEFGLGHLNREALEHAFPEFAPYLGQCRFRDCRHQQEPGCALQAATQTGHIAPERLHLFLTLAAE